MTTAQQLGLVGNSVRVQALPTASAETFGQGNRYYTLIGQQEGYITGHTYRTVVANDVYSWEDVAQAGPQGEDGKDYLIMIKNNVASSVPKVGDRIYNNWSMDSFNRQVFENDKGFTVMNCTSNKKQYAVIFNCTGVTTTHVGYITYTSVIEITGETGPQGKVGPQGEVGATGLVYKYTVPTITAGGTLQVMPSNFNRMPIVGETFVIFSRDSKYTNAEVTDVTPSTIVFKYSSTVVSMKGETGATGEAGLVYTKLYSSTINPNVVGTQTITIPTSGFNRIPKTNEIFILFNQYGYYLEATVSSIAVENNIQVAKCLIVPSKAVNINGTNGAQGIGVKSITSGTPTVVNDKTNTPITITLTDNTTVDLVVSAENGKDGTSATVDIVQATGQSESSVMSQKAVTDELAKKATTSEVNAKYTKPESGIPKSDLASSVQTSLGKADTALQNVPSYNNLPNIPVINQDLSASGFTPTANTYYRHTGATTDTFTQGVIYLYDTAYHKLGESGGGASGGGDYLTYKGDWVKNTAYNVNDVVTWKTNGRLYEVIKAHTSSSTIDPSNTEYYKAMTKKKWLRKELPGPNITDAKKDLLNIYAKDQNALIECVNMSNGVEILCRFSSNMCISGATFNSDDNSAEYITIDFMTGKLLYQQITATNTTTSTNANPWQIIEVAWEE